jgi:flagellar biosynthesis GTPase FlhF
MIEDYYVYIFSSVFATVGFLTRYLWEFIMARRKRELTEKINNIEFKLKEFYYPIFFYLKREQIIWDKILILYKNPTPSSPPISILPESKKALGKAIKLREKLIENKFSSIDENSINITIEENPNNEKPNNENPNNENPNNEKPNNEKPNNEKPNNEKPDYNEQAEKNIKTLNNQIDKILKIQDREDMKNVKNINNTLNLDIIKALDEENLKIHKYVQDIIHTKICIAIPPKELIDLFLQYDEHATVYQILREMKIYDKFPAQYGTPYPLELRQKIEERITYLNIKRNKYSKHLA